MREVSACRRRRRHVAAGAAKRRQPRDWLLSLTVSDSFAAAEVFFPDSRQERRREEPKDYASPLAPRARRRLDAVLVAAACWK